MSQHHIIGCNELKTPLLTTRYRPPSQTASMSIKATLIYALSSQTPPSLVLWASQQTGRTRQPQPWLWTDSVASSEAILWDVLKRFGDSREGRVWPLSNPLLLRNRVKTVSDLYCHCKTSSQIKRAGWGLLRQMTGSWPFHLLSQSTTDKLYRIVYRVLWIW